MKLILYQATFAITEIDFVPVPFRCQIKQQQLDFAVETKARRGDGEYGRLYERAEVLGWGTTGEAHVLYSLFSF